MPTLTVLLRHIHGVLLLGGKNLFQKATHQFRSTVESIQIGLYIVPQVVVLVAPMNGFLLGGGKFFFQAAVLHVHHIAVVSLFFQFGKFFFGQRVVAEKGALADIVQITRMNEGFFCERGLFLHSGKFLFGLGEGFVGLGEVLLFLVNLGGQAVQPFLLPLNFELCDGQVFFGAATFAALYIGVPGSAHKIEEVVLQDDFFNYMRNAGYTDVERGERGSTEEHLTVTQFKVQREQERLDTLTAQADQQAQSLAKTCQTLSKKEKELAAVQKKTTLTKEALIHARDLDYIGKRTFLGNYSLTEEEFSKLKKQADHGYMMDVENRRLKEELSTAKKEAAHWGQKYHELWYEVKPYLDALHRAPELVRGFLEKILAPKQERTMNVPQRNRRRGQDMEL